MSEIRFDGKVAVITGAGAGLGKTYAMELARRGAKVVVNDLGGSLHGSGSDSRVADLVVEEIRNAGGEAAANYDSVSTIQGGENIIKTAIDNFGRVDIVINNAGITRDKTLHKISEDEWDQVMDVHMKGAFSVTRAAYPYMRENKYGRIILTSSGAGLYGNFGQINYATAKMGMIGFMNVLKLEGMKYNILVNAIAPSAASRMTEEILPPQLFEKMRPEFVTPLVIYLSSGELKESGMIYNSIMGWYSRTAVMCCDGIIIGDGKRDVSAEEIRDNWGRINSLEGAKVLNNITESFSYLSSLFS